MKLNAKFRKILSNVCFVIAILCVLGFIAGSIITRPASPERYLNKIEKICVAKDKAKFAKLYAKSENMTEATVKLPFEGQTPEFLFENIDKIEKKKYRLVYTAYYEMDGNVYTYSGNELTLKKSFFGYKLLNE